MDLLSQSLWFSSKVEWPALKQRQTLGPARQWLIDDYPSVSFELELVIIVVRRAMLPVEEGIVE